MAKIARFWRGLADRLVCAECGASDWAIARTNYETEGRATCDECGSRAVYYRRGRTQPNAAAGVVEPDSLQARRENYIADSSNEWLTEDTGGR